MARLAIFCLVMLAAATAGRGQELAELVDSLNAVCRSRVSTVVDDCKPELEAVTSAVGISFPPAAGTKIDEKDIPESLAFPVGKKCCQALCAITELGCGCDDGTHNVLLQALGNSLGYVTTVMEYLKDKCTDQAVIFKLTLKGYKDPSGAEICASNPGITCP